MKDRIKHLRNSRKLSQIEFAKALNVSQTAVSQWETGRNYPDHETLSNIADFFDVSVDYILGRNTPANIEHFAREPVKVEHFPRMEEMESAKKEKAPISDEDLKFALFGRTDVDDKALNAVKKFARYVDDEEDD